MSKYPFGEYATAYMESMRGIYAETTWKTRSRRYRRMERKLIQLKEEKRIKTMSPKSMSEDDVKEYILFCKEQVSSEDLNHEIDALRKVLLFAGNSAVDVCLNHNPGLKPVCRNRRRICLPRWKITIPISWPLPVRFLLSTALMTPMRSSRNILLPFCSLW